MKKEHKPTDADKKIEVCLSESKNFAVIAGAGSGKTASLISALGFIRKQWGSELKRNNQKILCITYTTRAVDIISERLDFDPLFEVSTIHSLLWQLINRFQKNIEACLAEHIIPTQIQKAVDDYNGGNSQKAIKARTRKQALEEELEKLSSIQEFTYKGNNYSDFASGDISHDDIIELASYLITNNKILRTGFGFKYPYILIDEAQDTFEEVVNAINKVTESEGLPLVGYFGDPMQQIYENQKTDFHGPERTTVIEKPENFRSSSAVLKFTNRFRDEVEQISAGEAGKIDGSVTLVLVQAEKPEKQSGNRKVYSEQQLSDAANKFEDAKNQLGWSSDEEGKSLYLVHKMIARRQNFIKLLELYSSAFASSKASDDFHKGEHFLLKPFMDILCPLIGAWQKGDHRNVIEILMKSSPKFNTNGAAKYNSLKKMMSDAEEILIALTRAWDSGTIKDVLQISINNSICQISPRLTEHLERAARTEIYDKEIHSLDKADWLADALFDMPTTELSNYFYFVKNLTPYSTQHGSKGEEYENVIVIFDDTEANWTKYNFAKILAPSTHGNPSSDAMIKRGRKLAYVCFSRAIKNLGIVLYTTKPEATKTELVGQGVFSADQIKILS